MSKRECPKCHGEGVVEHQPARDGSEGQWSFAVDCPVCGGEGEVNVGQETDPTFHPKTLGFPAGYDGLG